MEIHRKRKPVEVKVTFKIEGGTWDGTNSEDQTTTVILTNGAGYLKKNNCPKVLIPPMQTTRYRVLEN